MSLVIGSCSHRGDSHEGRIPQPSDTAYTEEAAMKVFANNPQRALEIIDTALIVGNIDSNLATLLRAKVYIQSMDMHHPDTSRLMLESLMESDFVKNDTHNHYIVLDLLIQVSRLRDDYANWLRWSMEMADFCREIGKETWALRAEADMGVILSQMGDEQKGLAKLNGVIASLDGIEKFDEMDACIIALKRKINVLQKMENYTEVIPIAHHIIRKISEYRSHPSSYNDNTFRMPNSDEAVNSYCDFYSAQSYGFLANAYAEKGNMDSARYYLNIFESSDYSRSYSGRLNTAPTWCLVGDYDKMLDIYDEASKRIGDDTLKADYLNILYGRAKAAAAVGDYHKANGYWERYAKLSKQVSRLNQKGQAYQYASHYNLKEEQMKAEAAKRKAENGRNMIIVLLLVVVITLGSTIWLSIQQRAIKRKNHLLVENIAQASKMKVEMEQRKEEQSLHHSADAVSQANIDTFTDEELFVFLSNAIRSEKMFTDPSFGRQTLVDKFHLTDHRIGAAFAHGSQHNSLPEFVRELRLEYACQLFAEHPEMSIGDVALASGFSSSTVFGRDFKRKFDVTPTLYRSQLS